ncbi:MAG: hypothetical protein EHM45_01275 [Desulfobacteraceae bacterium]|nr:MAG: hypothetical protein EHM45_01275 [Desulfobacteraceae bacterium]
MKKREAATNVFRQQQNIADKIIMAEAEAAKDEFQGVQAGAMPPCQEAPREMFQAKRALAARPALSGGVNKILMTQVESSEELQMEKEPVKVRETGRWFWRRVIVPPNAYVVHTRIKRKEPVTLGLGVSFRFNPNTDSYLVAPAAMQTIGVVANCISKEKQGINVLAYVQWQIHDFGIAFKKLDFSDTQDPLGIVNAQLREQAEAAIKDKIATMSVEEVLTDKEPVIAELTTRLKQVAEGQIQGKGEAQQGLGIKIATVQIREAIVSSSTLWQDLQSPYRHEQKKKADISYLEMQNQIRAKELESLRQQQISEAETNYEIELIRQKKQTETEELRFREEALRFAKEQESVQERIRLEEQTALSEKDSQARLASKEDEIELKKQLDQLNQEHQKIVEGARLALETAKQNQAFETEKQLFEIEQQIQLKTVGAETRKKEIAMETALQSMEAELNLLQQRKAEELEVLRQAGQLERHKSETRAQLEVEESRSRLRLQIEEQQVKIERLRQEVRNLTNHLDLFSQLIKQLPAIAAEMPEIKELKVVQAGQGDAWVEGLTGFLGRIMAVAQTMGIALPGQGAKKE